MNAPTINQSTSLQTLQFQAAVDHNAVLKTAQKSVLTADSSAMQVIGLGVYGQAGGANGPEVPEQSLEQRRDQHVHVHVHQQPKPVRTPQRSQSRSPVKKKPNMQAKGIDDDEEHEHPLKAVAADALSTLQQDGMSALVDDLNAKYDVLKQYTLLEDMLEQLEEQGLSNEEKGKFKDQIQGKLAELMDQHGEEIEKGLEASKKLGAVLDAMGGVEELTHESMRELRKLYGGKGTDKTDAPMGALTMAKAMLEKFGPEKFNSGLRDVHGKVGSWLGKNQKSTGPQLWLSLSDANAATTVMSAFAIAGDLRTNLKAKAGVMPTVAPAEMMICLMTMAEGGKSKACSMADQIHNTASAGGDKSRVYPQIMQAVRDMPNAIWQNATQCGEVLDALRDQLKAGDEDQSSGETDADRTEQKLRGSLKPS